MMLGVTPILPQIAHPYVAYAIKQHSLSRGSAYLQHRFLNTLKYGFAIGYGTALDVEGAARTVYSLHQSAQGHLEEACGPFPAGHQYSATDVAALAWVDATIIEHGVLAYELFVQPLTNAEKEEYYQYARRTAPVWGVPSEALPLTWPAFLDDYADMLYSDWMCPTTPSAKRLYSLMMFGADETGGHAHARHCGRQRWSGWAGIQVYTLLPAPLRDGFSLATAMRCESKPSQNVGQWRFWLTYVGFAALRVVYGWLPLRLRQMPPYSEWKRRASGAARLRWPERCTAWALDKLPPYKTTL
jgi:uncharacterized protein (DUF2236 family)